MKKNNTGPETIIDGRMIIVRFPHLISPSEQDKKDKTFPFRRGAWNAQPMEIPAEMPSAGDD